MHGGINYEGAAATLLTIVVSEASTPPTPPLAFPTELPLPTSKYVSRQG